MLPAALHLRPPSNRSLTGAEPSTHAALPPSVARPLRRKSINFLVKKFERYGWTNKEDSGPALAKLIKISDYPVPAGGRPLLAEDDPAYFIDDDGIQVEKAVPLAGEVEAEEAVQQEEEGHQAAAAENGGGGGGAQMEVA